MLRSVEMTRMPAELRCLPIVEAPVEVGVEYGPSLVAPAERGGWTLGAWDGRKWYDFWTGAILSPSVWVGLPDAEALIHQIRLLSNL